MRPARRRRARPEMRLSSVVLPEPFGPDQPDDLALAAGVRSTSSSARRPAKFFTAPSTRERAARRHAQLAGRLAPRPALPPAPVAPAPMLVELAAARRSRRPPVHHQQDQQAEAGLGQAEGLRHGEAEEVEAALEPTQHLDGERHQHGAAERAGHGRSARRRSAWSAAPACRRSRTSRARRRRGNGRAARPRARRSRR